MTLYQAFTDWLTKRQEAIADGQQLHRKLLVISVQQTQPYLKSISDSYSSTLLISPQANEKQTYFAECCNADTTIIATKKYRSLLGTEFDCILFDARNGINLDALIASSGLLTASGLLVLMLPDHYKQTDSYHNKGIVYSYSAITKTNNRKSLFFSLLIKQLEDCKVMWVGKRFVNPSEEQRYIKQYFTHHAVALFSPFVKDVELSHQFLLSKQQQQVVKHVFQDDIKKTVHLVLGRRGRGKSTLLAAVCLGANKHQKVLITAPTKSQLAVFENYVQRFSLSSSNHYQFFPPDQMVSAVANLSRLERENAILLVDEVASIAPDLLKEIVKLCGKTVIAGTTQGYEGSGQGFLLRVVPYLKTKYRCNVHELSEAFRWLPNDPIEKFFEDLLGVTSNCSNTLIQNEQGVSSLCTSYDANNLDIQIVDKNQLICNPFLFRSVLTLLREAHYQTTANDIVRLLDAPDQLLLLAIDKTTKTWRLCGLTVLILEGGEFLNPLATEIAIGKRRVQGHLTPQALSLHLIEPKMCMYTCLRVNRIAVADVYRLQGIASAMLAFCGEYAKEQGISYLSTSFGFTEALLHFWHNSDFMIVKLGSRTDTSSGTVSALMIKNISLLRWTEISTQLHIKLNMDVNYLIDIYSLEPALRLKRYLLSAQNKHNKENLDDNLGKRLAMFVNSDISLDKVASVVWSFIKDHQNEMHLLKQAFVDYHQKGLHKHQKLNLQEQIKQSLSTYF